MNILFTRFPLESSFGGAEVQTLSLMKGLRDKGHEVGFLGSCPVLLDRSSQIGVRSSKLEIGDPPVTKWGAISFLWRKRKMTRSLDTALLDLRSRYAPTRDDMVIIMLSLTEKLLLTDWCVQHGIKVIWLEHDRVGRWLTLNPWFPRLRKLSTKAITVVVSSMSADIYRSLGWRGEVVAVPNGIENTKIRKCENAKMKQPPSKDQLFHIGCIARLTKDKGVDVLIEAVKDLPSIKLTIVGSGKEEQNIKMQLANMLPAHSSQLTAHVDSITDFYSQIDCLALPSRDNDPFGLVIAEAMAAGVPTICTTACGIASHLGSQDSIIVPADDVKAMKNAIEEVQIPEKWQELATRGPAVVREHFLVAKMVEQYEALLY